MDDALARAGRALAGWRGRGAAHAASAPGRVNLIGEHVDYNAGLVLPMAIDLRCGVVAARGGERGVVRVRAVDVDEEQAFRVAAYPRETRTMEGGDWRAYAEGVIDGVVRAGAGEAIGGLDLCVASDVPMGGGVSSSAAFEVALATVLLHGAGVRLAGLDVARMCQRAENVFAGAPCGLMDQAVSVLGRAGHALEFDCRSLETAHAPLGGDVAWLVVDTRVRHSIAGGEYAARRAACERAAAALGVATLREIGVGQLDAALSELGDEALRRAVRHVVTEIERVRLAAAALRGEDLERFGALMYESHESLRDDDRVSCAELDTVVDAARECEGVLGARMTGGGFGGSAIVLVRRGAEGEVGMRVGRLFEAAHRRACGVREVRASAGARVEATG